MRYLIKCKSGREFIINATDPRGAGWLFACTEAKGELQPNDKPARREIALTCVPYVETPTITIENRKAPGA